MPQYIMLVNFTDQGLKGVKDVPNRQDKSRETAKKFGVQREIGLYRLARAETSHCEQFRKAWCREPRTRRRDVSANVSLIVSLVHCAPCYLSFRPVLSRE